MTDVGGQKLEDIGGQRFRLEDGGQSLEVRAWRSEDGGQRMED